MNPKIRKILYTTDLSKNSAHAFEYAAELAKQNGAELIILHVLEELPKHARAYFETYMNWDKEKELTHVRKDELVGRIKTRLKLFCEKVFGVEDPQCEARVSSIEVCEGYPAEEILKKADELNCDAIVMGAHGKGSLRHTFLGSVTERVLRRVRKPVFIIPLPATESELTFHDI